MNETERSLGSGAAASAMTAHTPGRWYVDTGGELRVLCEDARCTIICDGIGSPSNPTAQADAHLIAAAPDLLFALQVMSAHYSASLDHQPAYVRLGRAAIAKASAAAVHQSRSVK